LRLGLRRLLLLLRGRPGNIEGIRRRTCGAAGREAELVGVWRRHRGDIEHRLRLELDDPRLELSVDAPQQRAHVEIKHRAIGIDDPAGLGPGRQRMERALLERLHDVGAGPNARGKIHFGQRGCRPQVSKQLRHLSVIAGGHYLDPVNRLAPLRGVRL
jgi:hypothetical protein